MAGSYNHAVTDTGDFRDNESFIDMIENHQCLDICRAPAIMYPPTIL